MRRPAISVCILAGHGREQLDACLASLGNQLAPPTFEVLIGGNPTTEARAVVCQRFPDAIIQDTGVRHLGAARNALIERARGDLLLFLDDDVTAPRTLLSALVQTANDNPKASVFGGPNDTPSGSSSFQIVQGAVLSSLIGSGPVSRRYGTRRACIADERWFTLCNLAVRREAMMPFPTELLGGEENAVLAELHRRGEQMRYEPRLRVFHARRPNLRSFAAQMFKYGHGRGELIRRDRRALRAAYAAPSALLLYLLLLGPAIAAAGQFWPLVLLPAAAYLALTVATAARIGWGLRAATAGPLAAVLTLLVHLCYGAGAVRGLWRRPPGHKALFRGRAPGGAPPVHAGCQAPTTQAVGPSSTTEVEPAEAS